MKSNAHRPPQRRCLQGKLTERGLIRSSKNTIRFSFKNVNNLPSNVSIKPFMPFCLSQRPTQITRFSPRFSHRLNTNMIFWGVVGRDLISNGLKSQEKNFYLLLLHLRRVNPFDALSGRLSDLKSTDLEFFVRAALCEQTPHGGDLQPVKCPSLNSSSGGGGGIDERLGIDRAITLISSRVIVPRRKFFLGGAIKNLASVKTTHASVTSPCGAQSKLGWTSMCKGRRWFSSRLGIQSHILVSLGLYST